MFKDVFGSGEYTTLRSLVLREPVCLLTDRNSVPIFDQGAQSAALSYKKEIIDTTPRICFCNRTVTFLRSKKISFYWHFSLTILNSDAILNLLPIYLILYLGSLWVTVFGRSVE